MGNELCRAITGPYCELDTYGLAEKVSRFKEKCGSTSAPGIRAMRPTYVLARRYSRRCRECREMRMRRITSKSVFEPAPHTFSNAIRYGNLVFTTAKSGTVPTEN
jgi:hypothetical protein